MSGLNSQALIDVLASTMVATGHYDYVNQHEPKSGPARGLHGAVWINRIYPATAHSGLAVTSVRVEFNCRIYTNMLTKPEDMIDPRIMNAADDFFSALSADFTLGGLVKQVDLLGSTSGRPLGGESGYINIDNKVYRVFTMTVPVIVNDAWVQSE